MQGPPRRDARVRSKRPPGQGRRAWQSREDRLSTGAIKGVEALDVLGWVGGWVGDGDQLCPTCACGGNSSQRAVSERPMSDMKSTRETIRQSMQSTKRITMRT